MRSPTSDSTSGVVRFEILRVHEVFVTSLTSCDLDALRIPT